MDAKLKLDRIGKLISANGCDCPCDHHFEDHDGDCERCLACLVGEVLQKPGRSLWLGSPGWRDPDHPCLLYEPRTLVQPQVFADCSGDGHYLCSCCARFDRTEGEITP
jgi:hypothetical protein